MLSKEEIALELTKIINDNTKEFSDSFLNETGVINTYKRVLEGIENVK